MFVGRMNYQKEFPGAPVPAYEDLSDRWKQAWATYNNEYVAALKEKK